MVQTEKTTLQARATRTAIAKKQGGASPAKGSYRKKELRALWRQPHRKASRHVEYREKKRRQPLEKNGQGLGKHAGGL